MKPYAMKPLALSLAVGSVFFSAKISAQNIGDINVGESVTDIILGAGDVQNVFGEAKVTTINSGANQYIYGNAHETTINYRGTQTIQDGGLTTKTVIKDGGKQSILNGGVSFDTAIEFGGFQEVYGGAYSTKIYSGGDQNVLVDGKAENTEIHGGTQLVSGLAIETIMLAGMQDVRGEATDTRVYGGQQTVRSGAVANSTTLHEGGLQVVNAGGKTVSTTINEGGKTWLESGAQAVNNVNLNNNGQLWMDDGATADSVINHGGTLVITGINAGSAWESAHIDNLSVENGIIAFLPDNSHENFPALTIGNIEGNGQFMFNTSLADRTTNFVTIEQGSGTFGVIVNDSGREISDHNDLTVNLIQDKQGDIDFYLGNEQSTARYAVDGGAYMYTLYNQQDKDNLNGNIWYLGALTDEPGDGGDGGGGDGNNGNENGGGKPITTPSTDAVLNMATAPLNVMSHELDALRAYRQTLPMRSDEDRHIWGHYLGGYSRVNADNGAAFSMQQHGMGIGADRRNRFESADWVLGSYIAFADNHVEHARGGKSKITSASGGLYTSWLQDSGFYLDAAVKTHRFKNQLSATMTNGQRTTGHWLRYGYTLDGEAGWRLMQSQPVNLTPYVRGTRFQVRNGDVSLTNGMTAQTGRSLSSKLEAGTRVGTQWQANTWSVKPYAHVAVVQEFAKGNKVVINGQHHITNNTDGTSARYGAGTIMALSAHTHIYAEAAYQKGRYIESPIEGTAGFRIAF